MNLTSPDQHPLAADLRHVLLHTEGLWEGVRGENIFVTGGTGFFGRWLLESFAHANEALGLQASLAVLSRNPDSFLKKAPQFAESDAIQFVRGDVRTFTAEDVRAQLRPRTSHNFKYIIHAATESTGNLSVEDPLAMIDTIVQGTRAALQFAVETGARRLLFVSSGAVYGSQPSDMTHIPEDYKGGPDPTNVRSAYGESKRLAELLCASFLQQHGVESVIARCFAFVGPFLPRDAHFAIGNFIRDALRGQPIEVNGDGTPYRSYLYAADLVIWLWTILLKGQPGRAYNVGSEEAHSIAAVAQIVSKLYPGSVVNVKQKPSSAKPAERYVPLCERARAELGLLQRIPLTDAVARTGNCAAAGLG